MKKLLLIGAMLIVGATSFSSVVEELKPGSNSKYSGNGLLPVNSTGKILDPTGRAMLVINPLTSAGPDGESILFNFGSVGRGRVVKQVGTFIAEVLTGKASASPSTDPPTIIKSDLTGKIIVNLSRNGGTGNKINRFVVKAPDASSADNTKNLVDLSYELTGTSGLSGDGKTYNGEILATAYRPLVSETPKDEAYIGGVFNDRSVNLEVQINAVTVEIPPKI